MKESLRIAIAQINPIVGDLGYNREKICLFTEEAKKVFADVIVFPELAVCGYPPEDLLLKPHFVRDNIRALRSIVKCADDIISIIGFADMDESEDIYNAAAVAGRGKVLAVYHKNFLPNYGVFDEKRYFKEGKENLIFRSGGVTFGVTICEDIWHEKGPYCEQAAGGARLLFNISASPFHAGKSKERFELLSKMAKRTGAFVCYVNLVGGQDELVFDGRSLILDPKGDIITSAAEFSEDLVLADIPIGALAPRKSVKKRKSGLKKVDIHFAGNDPERPPIHPVLHKKMGDVEEIYNALVLGTRDYVLKNGFGKVVLGLSGGIDSSLTAAIACDALDRENVTGVSMPSMFSSEETKNDARKIAENLGVRYLEVPINDIFQSYMGSLGNEVFDASHDLTEQNLQARIRGNMLMAFSNKFGWLVLTTGNKSETAVGYCTLYGDMAGGYAVIKDVPKTMVYELADFVNKKYGRPVIPDSVIKRVPTAELAPGQKDTDSLPPYDILDKVLKSYIEEDKSASTIKGGNITDTLVRKVINMVDKNEYKRRQAPAGVKITPKAFGKDRRLPITNRYAETGK